MSKIAIRFPKISDAERYCEILASKKFVYLVTSPKSIKEEREWILNTKHRRKNNIEWNYAITLKNKLVGAIGIRINQHRKYVGEIGYFVDENYWGKGIASQAVKLVEQEGFKKLELSRIEILMQPANKASEKVAIKNNYQKEGLMKKVIKSRDGKMKDAFLYAKVK
jgi:[ribosomal protein S5]-alanine N-acetyltransferase